MESCSEGMSLQLPDLPDSLPSLSLNSSLASQASVMEIQQETEEISLSEDVKFGKNDRVEHLHDLAFHFFLGRQNSVK